MPENPSSNVFIQSASQFRVLESVPDTIQQVGANADQHDTSHIAGAAAIENTNQATDTPDTELIAPAPEVPQTGDTIPTGTLHTGTSTSTGPDPTSPTILATTSTPRVDPTTMKALIQKRYQHKAKMVPGVAATAR
jgi:hypothetical protein